MNPHKILHIPQPRTPVVHHLIYPNHLMANLNFWKWGELRGGTPARIINGEYFAFFHSSFMCKKYGFYWYVMGAYTFESHPPFRITKISPHPIMFPTIYETKTNPDLDPTKRIIYPTGYAIRKFTKPAHPDNPNQSPVEKTHLHLSCGENDSTIKILTFDAEKLIKTLRQIPPQVKPT